MKKLTLSELSLIMKQEFYELATKKLVTMKPIKNKDDERIPDVEFTFKSQSTLPLVFMEIIAKIQTKGKLDKKVKQATDKVKEELNNEKRI